MVREVKLTVCTPTYNRGHLLGRLYASLVRQTVKDFEWVVIDDGSTDGTADKMAGWIAEGRIPIRYIPQPHGGKHRALNRALDVARGPLFFIVDSDDWIVDNAIEMILAKADILERPDVISLQFRTMNPSGRLLGTPLPKPELITDPITLREIDGVEGEMAEIFDTAKFKAHFRFPEIEGELFVPEALVWNRMAKEYKWLVVDTPIYFVEYQPDGLTARSVEIRHASPRATTQFYLELLHTPRLPLHRRLRALLNYWRFRPSSR